MARVLLGVTGGIAAYKACELCRLLVKEGHEVVPVLTPGAERFVTAETFEALARGGPAQTAYPHLERADLILIAPAMNPRMWAHPETQENAAVLRRRGVELIGPAEGDLAEGDEGIGRMAEPEEINKRISELLNPSNTVLLGKKVLVTAGGTREPLDAVRYVGNRSSGRMGVALAAEAARRGGDVTLLAANLTVPTPPGIDVVETPTADALLRETLARADADLILMA